MQMTCIKPGLQVNRKVQSLSAQVVFRPFYTQASQNGTEQSQLLKVPFLSYILSFNTSLQICRIYSSFPLRPLRLNTPLQVLGSCSSSSRTHPLSRMLLTPHMLRWVHGCTHREALWKFHTFVKQSSWSPERNLMGRQCQLRGGCWVWPCHPAHLHGCTLKPEHLLQAAQQHSAATTAVEGNCPALRDRCLSCQWSVGTASPGQLCQWGAQQLTFC